MRDGLTHGIRARVEEFLIPAQGAENLGSEFVFNLNVVGKNVGITEYWNFETRLESFGPNLQMAAGVTDVLPEEILSEVGEIAVGRERPGVGEEVWPFRERKAKTPCLIG